MAKALKDDVWNSAEFIEAGWLSGSRGEERPKARGGTAGVPGKGLPAGGLL